MPKIQCNITPIPGACFHSNYGDQHVPLKAGSSVSLVDARGTRIGVAEAVEPSTNDPYYAKYKAQQDAGFGKTGSGFWKFVVKYVFGDSGGSDPSYSEVAGCSEKIENCAPSERWNTST